MKVHLVDGTYELFRHYFAAPPASDAQGNEVGAVRGVLASVLGMLEGGATHVGVATDHVIESFRNELYAGYKTSEGVPASLLSQFPVIEEALERMGVVVWPMVEFEADDAMAAATACALRDERVEQVLLCSPDKDLAQCVTGRRVVQLDRMRGITRDEEGVVEKWGVRPESIPDYLAVVGDSADGFPGLPGWGAKAAAATLGRYLHLEDIPVDWRMWGTGVRGAQRLSAVLREQWEDALLFRRLATLRADAPVCESVDELEWQGPRANFGEYCDRLGVAGLAQRAAALVRMRRGE
jgi:5'-3' exonuclease